MKAMHSTGGFSEKVDSIVCHKMNQYNIPGLSIGIIRNDSILYTKGFGVRSIRERNLVTKNTIFHTASISKLFTATAIMDLVEENKLALDDRLMDILPELKSEDVEFRNITIKHLLNHTSGIPDISKYNWRNNNMSDNSLKEFILRLNLKLNFTPASKYQYSNLAYNILGYIIEKKSGTSFDDFLKENVLNRSGMNNSDFIYFNIQNSLKTSPHSKNWVTKNIY